MKTQISIALLLTFLTSHAAVITWTNISSGNWNVAANWDPNQVPTTNDTAIIANAGTHTVTLNINPMLSGLIVGGAVGTQTLATAGRTLTLNGEGIINTNGRVLLSGGALSGTNQINVAGVLSWEYGAIDTNASVMVSASGRVTLASVGNHAKLLYGTLTNAGVVNWQLHGSFDIGSTLHNLAGALFEIQEDSISIHKSGSNAVVINDGVIRKSVGSGNISCYVPLLNYGRVDVQGGTLTLQDGSILGAGCEFTGAGATRLNAGTNTLKGGFYSENLVLAGDALAGTGSLSGTVTWYSGELSEGAALTVATNGTLILSSSGNFTKSIAGSLTNCGTVTWLQFGNLSIGGTLHNRAGALFDVQLDNRSILRAQSNAVIINDGVFRKSAGTSAVGCGVPMINNGTIEVLLGTLRFSEAFSNSVGTVSLAGGEFEMTRPLFLAGGLLTGWGAVSADVTNAARIRPSSSNGVLRINGEYEQLLSGRLEFEIGGNLPGTNQSRLNITGGARLRGTVGVIWNEGYTPAAGTNFPVLTFASHTGEFCCFDNCIRLGQDRRLTPVYTATSLTLATIAAPDPTNVPLRVAVDGGAIVAWPVEFPGFELYWSTNLSFTNWTLIPGVTNRYLEPPPLPREKFFLLRKTVNAGNAPNPGFAP